MEAAAQPGGLLFETIHRRKDGTTFPVEISARTIWLDEHPAAEELRFEYAAKLRDEIKDLRRELDAAQAQAQPA